VPALGRDLGRALERPCLFSRRLILRRARAAQGAGDAASASLGERANAEAGPPEPEHPATLHDPYGDGRRRRPPLAHDWQDAQGNSGVGGGSAAQWAPRSPRDVRAARPADRERARAARPGRARACLRAGRGGGVLWH
jgi:hypothetical protein